jgi:hypothetical protein
MKRAHKKVQEKSDSRLSELSADFYRLIPHSTTPAINSDAIMKEKLLMLEVTP